MELAVKLQDFDRNNHRHWNGVDLGYYQVLELKNEAKRLYINWNGNCTSNWDCSPGIIRSQ